MCDNGDAKIMLNTKDQNFGKRHDYWCKCDNEIRMHIGLDGNAFQKTMKEFKKKQKKYQLEWRKKFSKTMWYLTSNIAVKTGEFSLKWREDLG